MSWIDALLVESTSSNSEVSASYQGRLVLACLLYHEKFSFSGNLNKVALGVGLKPAFFRKGVKNLLSLNWLVGESNNSMKLGPPSQSFQISNNLPRITTQQSDVENWQMQAAESLLFSIGKKRREGVVGPYLPGRIDVVLAVLILSSNQAGFVCNLSQKEIADRCGIANSGLKRFLSQLQGDGFIVQLPGGGGKKIVGSGWLVKTVYQIGLNRVNEFIGFNVGQSVLVNNDYFEYFYRDAGLFKVWPKHIKGGIPQSPEYKYFMQVFTGELTGGFSETITTNLISRLLSATSYLLSNKDFQSVFKRLRDETKSTPTLKEQKSMVESLSKNKSIGIQLGLVDKEYNYHELIDDFKAILEKKRDIEKEKAKRANETEDVLKEEVPLEKLPKYDPLPLISLCLSFLAIRFSVFFYSNNHVPHEEGEAEQEQEGIYMLQWLPNTDGIHYFFLKYK